MFLSELRHKPYTVVLWVHRYGKDQPLENSHGIGVINGMGPPLTILDSGHTQSHTHTRTRTHTCTRAHTRTHTQLRTTKAQGFQPSTMMVETV